MVKNVSYQCNREFNSALVVTINYGSDHLDDKPIKQCENILTIPQYRRTHKATPKRTDWIRNWFLIDLATKGASGFYRQKGHSTTSPCSRFQSLAIWGRYVERSADAMREEFKDDFLPRAVKKRVELLIDKFQKKQLKYCSGTEEETTERGLLLETIIAIKEEESIAINTETTPDDEEVEDNDNEDETSDNPAPRKNTAKERRLERLEADKEREEYADQAPGPSGSRGKRQRMSVEEGIMVEKHKHDMDMDKEKMEIEKLREKEKIELEKLRIKSEEHREEQRLTLERQREERMIEESRRRDEIAKSQIDLQTSMMKIMEKFLEK